MTSAVAVFSLSTPRRPQPDGPRCPAWPLHCLRAQPCTRAHPPAFTRVRTPTRGLAHSRAHAIGTPRALAYPRPCLVFLQARHMHMPCARHHCAFAKAFSRHHHRVASGTPFLTFSGPRRCQGSERPCWRAPNPSRTPAQSACSQHRPRRQSRASLPVSSLPGRSTQKCVTPPFSLILSFRSQ